jgi:hypothetical protein
MRELYYDTAPAWAKQSWVDQAPILGVADRQGLTRGHRAELEAQVQRLVATWKGPILIRGMDLLDLVPHPLVGRPQTPLLVDAWDGRQVPVSGAGVARLQGAARVVCYSTEAFNAFRDKQVIRLRRIPGPYLAPLPMPPPEPNTVGILETCSRFSTVLASLMRNRPEGVTVYATTRVPGVTVLPNEREVLARSQVLMAPQEDTEQGGPAWGGILAIAAHRPLITTPTSAFSLLSYPQNGYLFVPRRTPSAWWKAWERYQIDPAPYHRKPSGALRPDTTRTAFLEGL